MEHSSYEMGTGMVTLHQFADYDRDDNMRYIEGEDWLDPSILDAKPKLNIGSMDSGIIFNHDDGASMGLMTTKV